MTYTTHRRTPVDPRRLRSFARAIAAAPVVDLAPRVTLAFPDRRDHDPGDEDRA